MSRPKLVPLLLFLAGYAVHVVMALGASGRLDLPLMDSTARILGLIGLLLAVATVWRELAKADEVQRGFALTACASSFAVTAALAYLSVLPGFPRPVPEGSLWAVAMLIWLLVFGGLQARARW